MRARNAGGVSSYSSATGWFYTTPATPTGVAISGDSLSALKLKYASNSDYVYGVQVRKGTTTILTVGTGLSGVAKSNISLPGTYEGSDTFSVRTFAGPDDSERGRAYSEWSAASRSVASQIVPKPTLVASATRGVNGSENPFGTQMLVTARGSASTIVGGNYMMLRARYKASTASSWGGWNTNFQNVAAGAVAKRTFTLTGTLDVTVVYDVQVDLSDSYGTTRWEGTVSTGEVALSLSKTGAAVGRIWDENSPATLQVAGHVEVEDPNVIVIGGVAYQRSGTINLGKVPITTAAGSMYRSDQVTVSMPYAPPPGWRWAFISVARAASSPIILHGYADLLTSQPIIILGAPSSVTTTSLYVTWMLVKNS